MAMIDNDWLPCIQHEFKKPYYKELYRFIRQEYNTRVVYPPADDIFNAFHLTPLSEVKALILGQDPYHGPRQAHGLCFSVLPDQSEIPPSLQNIYQELKEDLGCFIPNNGYLEKWATGSFDAQYGAYSAGPSAGFPSRQGLGAVYRCDYSGGKCTGEACRVSSLGTACPKQDSHAYNSRTFDTKGASSKSVVGFQRFFWM